MKFLKNLPTYALALIFVGVSILTFVMIANGTIPPAPEGLQTEYAHVLFASGFMYLLKSLELVIGVLLFIPRTRRLALILIAPIVLNIFLFEVLIARQAGLGIVLVLLNAIALYQHREAYFPIVAKY